MKIILLSDNAIRLVPEPGPMTIEASSIEQQYSPFHMLASSLATCTFSVLHSWAVNAKVSAEDLAIEVRWQFAEDPYRVGEMRISYDWPSLPQSRARAVARAAELCTVHATLRHSPSIVVEPTAPVAASTAPADAAR